MRARLIESRAYEQRPVLANRALCKAQMPLVRGSGMDHPGVLANVAHAPVIGVLDAGEPDTGELEPDESNLLLTQVSVRGSRWAPANERALFIHES